MKLLYFIIVLIFCVDSHSQTKITGKTTLPNQTKIYISKKINNRITVIDSTFVSKGKIKIEVPVETENEFIFIDFGKENNRQLTFLSENANLKYIEKDNILTGSLQNNSYSDYKVKSLIYLQNIESVFEANKLAISNKFSLENSEKKSIAYSKINVEKEKYTNFQKQFIRENPAVYYSYFLLDGLYKNSRLSIDEIVEFSEILQLHFNNNSLTQSFLTEIQKHTKLLKGTKAPDFKASNPEGKLTSLNENLGKITLIDFWASWCGPCRQENPNVVALYEKYKHKGLQIIGVSLDKTNEAWNKAILKDNLSWIHVSNLKFWDDPIAKQYGVDSIPATFILDADGKIIAKDLRGDELANKIKELLN